MGRALAGSGWLLACAVGACGQVGIDLLPAGQGAGGAGDALDGGPSGDAGQVDAEAGLDPNVPVSPADAASRDAATPSDASAAADAGTLADAGRDAGPSACGGAPALGLCWYLGAANQSCDEACAARGGFDARATSFVGTSSQGGSVSACAQIMAALGNPGPVREGMRTDDNGFGCHVWPGGDLWWLDRPSFRPSIGSSRGTDVRIACGCER